MPLATHLMTRRGLIGWALGASALCGRVYAFASDFWNKKAPADWSSDEVHTLLTKSPLAKSVTAEIAHSQNSHPSTSNPSNQTGIDNPRIGTSTNPNRANLTFALPGHFRRSRRRILFAFNDRTAETR